MENKPRTAQDLIDELNAIPITQSIPLTSQDDPALSITEPHPVLRLLTTATNADTNKDG